MIIAIRFLNVTNLRSQVVDKTVIILYSYLKQLHVDVYSVRLNVGRWLFFALDFNICILYWILRIILIAGELDIPSLMLSDLEGDIINLKCSPTLGTRSVES